MIFAVLPLVHPDGFTVPDFRDMEEEIEAMRQTFEVIISWLASPLLAEFTYTRLTVVFRHSLSCIFI
jgi:hypothetical protein